MKDNIRNSKKGIFNATKRWIKLQYLKIIRIDDTPEKIALGMALGIASGILPTFGLGIIFAIFLALVFKANKVSAVIGTMIMNPWTSVFFWTLSYILGELIIHQRIAPNIDSAIMQIKYIEGLSIFEMLKEFISLAGKEILLPYLVGNIILTVVLSLSFYFITLKTVIAYRTVKKKGRLIP